MSSRKVFLAGILASALGSGSGPLAAGKGAPAARLPDEGAMPSLAGATAWINSPPLGTAGLQGKVVLVGFWTHSCINWLRSQPYLRAWAEKYKNQGLVVIGVHTPEFDFEKNVDAVRRAAKELKVDYPIAVDSDSAIWRAFSNEYWPALYFVDARGRIRHHHFGEGDYDASERILQQLLAEAGSAGLDRTLVKVEPQGAEAEADWAHLRSPETYVGYERGEGLASPGGAVLDRSHLYAAPARLGTNAWALTGDWTVEKQRARLDKPGGRLTYRFHARDLHLVMGPGTAGPVRVRVRIDGQPPGDDHGSDLDVQGNGTLDVRRLYQLVRQRKPVVDRQFEIEFLDPGVEVYSFTFG